MLIEADWLQLISIALEEISRLISDLTNIYIDLYREEGERTILHHVPSPTGLTRWNIQRIPNECNSVLILARFDTSVL